MRVIVSESVWFESAPWSIHEILRHACQGRHIVMFDSTLNAGRVPCNV